MKKKQLSLLLIINILLIAWIFVFCPWIVSGSGVISQDNLTGVYKAQDKLAFYDNNFIPIPQSLTKADNILPILGQTSIPKRIEVDLTHQRIYAYEGNRLVYNFLISSGKWYKTPTGVFSIWIKLRYTKMEGGSKTTGTYYNLPNVPYTMFFYNESYPKYQGFGIHGTYWHNNFGHPMSHGCINMKNEDVALLYDWAQPDNQGKSVIRSSQNNPGTPVIIYGYTPAT